MKRKVCSIENRATYTRRIVSRSGGFGPHHQSQRGRGALVGWGRCTTSSWMRVLRTSGRGGQRAPLGVEVWNGMEPAPALEPHPPIVCIRSLPLSRRCGPGRWIDTGQLRPMPTRLPSGRPQWRIGREGPLLRAGAEGDHLLSRQRHSQLDRVIAGIESEGWAGLPRSALAQQRTNLLGGEPL